jgi:hypothetical protein
MEMFSRLGRGAGFQLVLVASVCAGLGICRILNLFNQPSANLTLYRFSLLLEPIAIAILAVLLLITRRRILAWFLAAYSFLMVGLFLLSGILHVLGRLASTRGVAYAIIHSLIGCLLVIWLQEKTSGDKDGFGVTP